MIGWYQNDREIKDSRRPSGIKMIREALREIDFIKRRRSGCRQLKTGKYRKGGLQAGVVFLRQGGKDGNSMPGFEPGF